jgi:hypothetical protein
MALSKPLTFSFLPAAGFVLMAFSASHSGGQGSVMLFVVWKNHHDEALLTQHSD